MGEMLTVEEVAKELKVRRETILRYIRAKELRAATRGRVYRIRREDLEAFLRERGAGGGEEAGGDRASSPPDLHRGGGVGRRPRGPSDAGLRPGGFP